MLGLTERPVIAPYAIAIEYADQHIPVLRLPMDPPILAGFQRPCQDPPVFARGEKESGVFLSVGSSASR